MSIDANAGEDTGHLSGLEDDFLRSLIIGHRGAAVERMLVRALDSPASDCPRHLDESRPRVIDRYNVLLRTTSDRGVAGKDQPGQQVISAGEEEIEGLRSYLPLPADQPKRETGRTLGGHLWSSGPGSSAGGIIGHRQGSLLVHEHLVKKVSDQFCCPCEIDSSAFRATFSTQPTPFEEACSQTDAL